MGRTLKKIVAAAMLIVTAVCGVLPAQKVYAADISFLLQAATALEPGNDIFDYAVGDYNNDGHMDVFALKKVKTGKARTELHILDGSRSYKSFLLEVDLPLEAGNNFKFSMGDFNGDGQVDLFAIKKAFVQGRCEVHVLDGKSNYSRFLLQKAVPLEAAEYWEFAVSDYNGDKKLDLYALKKSTRSGKAELHILDGSSSYSHFLEQRVMPLTPGTSFSFCIGNFNGDSKPDVYALKKNQTGTGTTEIHVLSGVGGYQRFFLQSGINLETGENFVFAAYDYNHDGRDDLVAIKRRNAKTTEVHVLNVSGNRGNGQSLHSPVPSGSKFSKKTADGNWYGYHDINRNIVIGTPVYAIADGTITCKQAYRTYRGVNKLTSYGNYIEFQSSDGNYSAKYCHLNGFNGVKQIISSSKTVRASGCTGVYTLVRGRSVKRGDVIGYIGTTGNSTGAHLHFELYKNKERIDPTSVIGGLS